MKGNIIPILPALSKIPPYDSSSIKTLAYLENNFYSINVRYTRLFKRSLSSDLVFPTLYVREAFAGTTRVKWGQFLLHSCVLGIGE